jgi:putative aldouronate transport system permease protein
MTNPLNYKVSQTLDVFVYQQGIQAGQFSYASAIGLMKAVVSVNMVLTSNKIAHLLGEQGLY